MRDARGDEPTTSGGDEPSDATDTARPGRLLASVGAIRERLDRWSAQHGWLGVIVDLVDRSRTDGAAVVAGYLAYRFFIMLLPIGAIVVAISGYDQLAAADTADGLGLGKWIAATIAQAGEDAERSRLPLLVTGVVGFVVASWGLLGALQFAAAVAWRIPARRFPGKGRAVIRLAGSLLLFVGILYLSLVVRRAGLLAGLAATSANTAAAAVAFFALTWMLPHRCTSWYWLLPGTATGAGGILVLQLLATYYLPDRLSSASTTYGVLGVALSLLTYLFLLGVTLWLAVLVDAVVWDRYRDAPPGLLRRVAQLAPIPETRFASGFVPEGGVATTVTGPRPPPGRPGGGPAS